MISDYAFTHINQYMYFNELRVILVSCNHGLMVEDRTYMAVICDDAKTLLGQNRNTIALYIDYVYVIDCLIAMVCTFVYARVK